MGTGMAFPWKLIQQAEIASGHIVEDLKLGLDFAKIGLAPRFCPDVAVTSFFPLNNDGVKTQRTRWEHGHLGMILRIGPNLILESIKLMNLNMLALTLDMCVPPLALLTLLVFSLAATGVTIMFLTKVIMPWILGALLFLILGVSVLLVWAKFARKIIPFTSLAYIPIYAVAKIPLYFKFILKRQVEWVRSRRD
jgi:cellulose synthase/poly-beta-1,6-N-acetylglucosamine synthase-like glycosyltransferase